MFVLTWAFPIGSVHQRGERDGGTDDDPESRGCSFSSSNEEEHDERHGDGQERFLDKSKGRHRPCHAQAIHHHHQGDRANDHDLDHDFDHDQAENRETNEKHQTHHATDRHYENYSDVGDAICSAHQRTCQIRSGERETW